MSQDGAAGAAAAKSQEGMEWIAVDCSTQRLLHIHVRECCTKARAVVSCFYFILFFSSFSMFVLFLIATLRWHRADASAARESNFRTYLRCNKRNFSDPSPLSRDYCDCHKCSTHARDASVVAPQPQLGVHEPVRLRGGGSEGPAWDTCS